MSETIEIGDTVIIEFENLAAIHGVVEYIPCATGDSWRIKTLSGNALVYVQHFCTITRKTNER
ncbi:hypothetical protein D3C83_128350 [compost metagenome]